MTPRFLVRTSALALLLLVPGAAFAQGVTIEHEEVGCIVAGKHPKMNACFAPASLVKKARVYFRPETLSTWYYVEMTSDAPCFSGVLLKPSKSLIDKKIFYYLDVQGGDSRTPEYAPVVVANEDACKSKRPVAPVSASGPAAIFPSLPAGFIGPAGFPTRVVAAGVAAVAGGTMLLTDDGSPTTTTPATIPTTNPPATTTTTTVPPNVAPLVVACQATPRTGVAPLRVSFATFPNGGTDSYDFLWSFGDGGSSNNPNPSHTFVSAGVFNATVNVRSGVQIAACSRPITVTRPPTTTTTTTMPPPPTTTTTTTMPPPPTTTTTTTMPPPPTTTTTTTMPPPPTTTTTTTMPPPPTTTTTTTMPPPPTTTTTTTTMPPPTTTTTTLPSPSPSPVTLTFTATDDAQDCSGPPSVKIAPPGTDCVGTPTGMTCSESYPPGTPVQITSSTNCGSQVCWSGACAVTSSTLGSVCMLQMDTDTIAGATFVFGSCSPAFQTGSRDREARPMTWSTALEVPDGEGQVVMNGRVAYSVRQGLAAMTAERRRGANRVEAVLVRGAGRPGTWRFALSGQTAFRPGSLRVVAGTAALITDDTVVFRLQGKSGERIVFAFEVE